MVDEPAARAEHDHASGEWQLLLSRLNDWIATADAAALWERFRRPLLYAGWLLLALIVLKVYGALVGTIDSVPLMGGLLELVGVIWLSRFAVERLLRRSDRQQLLDGLETRWRRFLGQG
ncbi:MAG: hypothetical protein EBZ51_03430 [Synechococcaceae bacterium WB9_2_112]|nr:hypothetical protein [Synechococcaceae bacterium WB9_2_112]